MNETWDQLVLFDASEYEVQDSEQEPFAEDSVEAPLQLVPVS